MADFSALRQRHSDPVLLALMTATAARLLVSTMRTHHGSYERMAAMGRLARALLASADAAAIAENMVKQMVRAQALRTRDALRTARSVLCTACVLFDVCDHSAAPTTVR